MNNTWTIGSREDAEAYTASYLNAQEAFYDSLPDKCADCQLDARTCPYKDHWCDCPKDPEPDPLWWYGRGW